MIVNCLIVVPLWLGVISSQEVEVSPLESCAIPALYQVLTYNGSGSGISAGEVMAAFPTQPKHGYSMNDIINVAKKFNVELEGYYFKDAPNKISEPLILYTNGKHGHYIALLPVGRTGENVVLIDGYKFPKTMNVKKVVEKFGWSGKVLKKKEENKFLFVIYCIGVFCVSGFVFHRALALQKSKQRANAT